MWFNYPFFRVYHSLLYIKNSKDSVSWFGLAIIRSKDLNRIETYGLSVSKQEFTMRIFFRIKIFGLLQIMLYRVEVPYRDILNDSLHSPVLLKLTDPNGFNFEKNLSFLILPRRSLLLHSPIKILKDINTSIFLRQGNKNYIYITAREINVTDRFIEMVKIFFAFILSRILFLQKTIILFEKKCEKYEESASAAYEKLIDQGRKNVYYIFDKQYSDKYEIPEEYRKNVVNKFSFKHYLVFFQSKLFLSTETPYHAVELRTLSKLIHFKLRYMKYKYVFLQHGVMYMVSLDSGTRSTFRYGNIFKDNSRIVVSSELEAKHFIEKGNFPKKNLLVSGLPKFDKNIRYDNADKIVIMPTWRLWEFTDSRIHPEKTNYYKMLKEIFSSIPKEYKDKVVILPHPLIVETVKDTELSKYFPKEIKYDEILRSADLLITDYSSIAYDAFYRGSNVIFWWKEKDECMEAYGGKLMLNKSNVFGDVVYDKQSLSNAVKQNYKDTQKDKYINRYRKIVKYNDNKNTERLIKMLEKENFL